MKYVRSGGGRVPASLGRQRTLGDLDTFEASDSGHFLPLVKGNNPVRSG